MSAAAEKSENLYTFEEYLYLAMGASIPLEYEQGRITAKRGTFENGQVVAIVCGKKLPEDKRYLSNPEIIFEVLSDSTRTILFRPGSPEAMRARDAAGRPSGKAGRIPLKLPDRQNQIHPAIIGTFPAFAQEKD